MKRVHQAIALFLAACLVADPVSAVPFYQPAGPRQSITGNIQQRVNQNALQELQLTFSPMHKFGLNQPPPALGNLLRSGPDAPPATRALPKVVVAESMNIKELGIPDIIDVSGLSGDEKNTELIRLNPDVILVRSAVKITATLMAQMPNLKVIIRGGHGTDNIDMEYANEHGIRVLKTGGSERFVAALVMRMIARVEQGDEQVFEQDAADPESFLTIPEWKEAFDEKTKGVTGDRLSVLTNKWNDVFRPIGLPTLHALKGQTVGMIG